MVTDATHSKDAPSETVREEEPVPQGSQMRDDGTIMAMMGKKQQLNVRDNDGDFEKVYLSSVACTQADTFIAKFWLSLNPRFVVYFARQLGNDVQVSMIRCPREVRKWWITDRV